MIQSLPSSPRKTLVAGLLFVGENNCFVKSKGRFLVKMQERCRGSLLMLAASVT